MKINSVIKVFFSVTLMLVPEAKATLFEKMETLVDLSSKKLHGPNCWNSALYVSGLAKQVRFTSNQEFQVLMESPYCVNRERPKAGSIKIYRVSIPEVRGPKKEVHAAIWIDENNLFNKMTALSTSTHRIESVDQVDSKYAYLPSIVRIPIQDELGRNTQVFCSGSGCENTVSYRDCQALSFIEQDIRRDDFKEIYRKLGRIEEKIAAILFLSELPAESFVLNRLEDIEALEEKLSFLRASSDLEVWQIEYMSSVMISLKDQLTMNQPNWF